MSERRRESKVEGSAISAFTGAQLEEEIDHGGEDDAGVKKMMVGENYVCHDDLIVWVIIMRKGSVTSSTL